MGRRRQKRYKKKKVSRLKLFLLVFFGVFCIGLGFLSFRYYQILQEGETTAGFLMAKDREDTYKEEVDVNNFAASAANISIEELASAGSAEGEETLEQQGKAEQTAISQGAAETKYGAVLADPAYMEANRIYVKETSSLEEFTLSFAGDICFDDSYSIMNAYRKRGNKIENHFSSDLLELMRESDILMLNNEFTYTTRGVPTEGKQYTFRSNPANARILQDMGVDIAALANNHMYDYGEISLLDTVDTLKNIDMPYVGAGRNFAEASAPVYFIMNDMKVAFLSATQVERTNNPDTKGATDTSAGVFRCLDSTNMINAIKAAKENSDFVVIYVHWGTESTTEIDWRQRDQAIEYEAAGADLIIGDHTHCLQEITYINDTPVIYSLGNFWFNSKTQDTCLVKVTVNEQGIKNYQFLPCKQQDFTTTLLQGGEKERVLQEMRRLSPNVNIDSEGFVTKK